MDKRSMMKYALAESIKMMGEKLYSKYNDSCCCSCGFREDGQFVYSLCMHTKPFVYKMGDETPYGNESISSLKGADRVRKRPGVIFGSDGLDGCEHAVLEIL